MFIIFFISALAETNRRRSICLKRKRSSYLAITLNIRLMTFALFFLGEYANMILMSGMTVTVLFLGGWLPPILTLRRLTGAGYFWFAAKIGILLLFVLLVGARNVPALSLRPA
jgi:NADH-quinone oxidoreductase subunit H